MKRNTERLAMGLAKLKDRYKKAYSDYEKSDKPFYTFNRSRYLLFQDDDRCFIVFRTTKKIADPITGKKRYHIWSIRYIKINDSMKLTDHITKTKLIDARNCQFELDHNYIWNGEKDAPAFVPLFKKRELSQEAKDKLTERGKKLVQNKRHECPFCFESNFSIKANAIVVCKGCGKSFAIGA